MNTISLPYMPADQKHRRLQSLLGKDWAMLLDSGTGIVQQAGNKAKSYRQFDICVYQPSLRLTFDGQQTIIENTRGETEVSNKTPLLTMRNLLNEYKKQYRKQYKTIKQPSKESSVSINSIPFNGGWIGYISYDFGKQQLLKNSNNESESPMLTIRMGLYQWALISNHTQKTTTLHNFGLSESDWQQRQQEIKVLLDNKPVNPKQNHIDETSTAGSFLTKKFQSNMSFSQYSKAFHKVKEYIRAGDCYQVNLAQKFTAGFNGSAFEIYSMLVKHNNSPFSAFLNFSDQQIISLSPERFIESHQGKVRSQPIKGTLPRDPDPIKDQLLGEQLINSEKDKAENLMIVDLLRNDLSKTATKGSVKVTELFAHYQFESVHHLISTIESKLSNQFDNFDILATTLPGGSITGAPKIRAMQIIDELESAQRGIYCGVIGYIDFEGNMDTNICIRTLVAKGNQLHCWAGGGLVADSQLELEYQETFDKLNKILPILNQTIRQI